ncbi:MAG: ROK family protein [Planctomycetes bacterium]|nr:ROK family protein [Planctomycetota bacterium]
MYLGIEIGGTKLQLGIGPGDGTIVGLWRGVIDPAAGGEGIRRQILSAIPELLGTNRVAASRLKGAGIGFGGPIDDSTQRVIKSHQVAGWDNFPIAAWLAESLKVPVFLGNDADVAGLAEALHGAGQGLSPVFYITVGSGIGGGLIVDGAIYRGVGRGAAEIGHLRVHDSETGLMTVLEEIASGWAIGRRAQRTLRGGMELDSVLRKLTSSDIDQITARHVTEGARQNDALSRELLGTALDALAEAIAAVIVLLCPKRIVIGGGVALIGEEFFFGPLRKKVASRTFPPFAGLTEIVPAALGEAVVVHGALALARAGKI